MDDMNPDQALGELRQLESLLTRASRRLDPHAFHYVHWGCIVLAWYPLENLVTRMGHDAWRLPIGVCAVGLGMLLSLLREKRLQRSERVAREDPALTKRILLAVYGCVAVGVLFSALLPSLGLLASDRVVTIWGLVYVNIAFVSGLLYRSSFLWAALFILVGVVLAVLFPAYAGFILGPFAGLGMIVPGRRAESSISGAHKGGAELEGV